MFWLLPIADSQSNPSGAEPEQLPLHPVDPKATTRDFLGDFCPLHLGKAPRPAMKLLKSAILLAVRIQQCRSLVVPPSSPPGSSLHPVLHTAHLP